MKDDEFLEKLWENLLSRDKVRVQEVFTRLESHEQQSVLEHLERMTTEDGWHPEQRTSARAALEALAPFR